MGITNFCERNTKLLPANSSAMHDRHNKSLWWTWFKKIKWTPNLPELHIPCFMEYLYMQCSLQHSTLSVIRSDENDDEPSSRLIPKSNSSQTHQDDHYHPVGSISILNELIKLKPKSKPQSHERSHTRDESYTTAKNTNKHALIRLTSSMVSSHYIGFCHHQLMLVAQCMNTHSEPNHHHDI